MPTTTLAKAGTKNVEQVILLDASTGDPASLGGGTQYTEGDTDASITGTAMLMEGAGNALVAAQGTAADGLLVNLGTNNDVTVTGVATATKQSDGSQKTQIVDGSGNVIGSTSNALDVNIASGASSGTEYTEDAAAAANPAGGALILVREDARAGSLTTTDGDNVAARGNNKGEMYVKTTDSDALLTTIDADTGNISTKIDTVAGAVSGTEMQVDVVSSALPSGASTSAKQDTIIGHVDGIETLLGTIDTDTGAIVTSVASIDTKTPALGQALAAASVPVVLTAAQITTLTPVSTVTVTGVSTLAEQQTQTTHLATIAGDTTDIETAVELIDDTVATLGTTTYTEATSKGLVIGAVRRDADTTLVNTTNEVAPLQVDANGRLKVEAFSGETLPVSLTSTTVTGTVAVTQSGTWDEVGINDSGNSITVDYATTGSGTATGALRVELPTNGTGVIATVGAVTAITNALPAGTNAIGKLAANSGVDIGDVDVTSVNGFAAHDAAIAGNPLIVGGVSSAAAPTSVTADQEAVRAWYLRNGAAATVLTAAGALIGGDATNGLDVDVTRSALPTGASTLAEQQSQTTHLATIAGDTTAIETAVQIMDDWDNAASDGASVSGDVAHDTADAGEPVKIGGKAVSANPTAVTANDRVNALFDLIGRMVVTPYTIPESMVSGAITSAMTGTTSTSLIAAPASGLRNYITTIICSNAHATVGTDIVIQDGSGGTTLLTIPAAAVYGGAVITLPTPLRQPTTATAIYCANVTTGASTKVSAVGYTGI